MPTLSPIVVTPRPRLPLLAWIAMVGGILFLGLIIMAVTMTGYHHDDPWPWGTCKIKMQVTTPPPVVVVQPAHPPQPFCMPESQGVHWVYDPSSGMTASCVISDRQPNGNCPTHRGISLCP